MIGPSNIKWLGPSIGPIPSGIGPTLGPKDYILEEVQLWAEIQNPTTLFIWIQGQSTMDPGP